tara:strand:+ start:13277 stop:13513 length:237 start_codon:yes stop_codon:yes gene_type:complete
LGHKGVIGQGYFGTVIGITSKNEQHDEKAQVWQSYALHGAFSFRWWDGGWVASISAWLSYSLFRDKLVVKIFSWQCNQ